MNTKHYGVDLGFSQKIISTHLIKIQIKMRCSDTVIYAPKIHIYFQFMFVS